jgi:hypothetical protein
LLGRLMLKKKWLERMGEADTVTMFSLMQKNFLATLTSAGEKVAVR